MATPIADERRFSEKSNHSILLEHSAAIGELKSGYVGLAQKVEDIGVVLGTIGTKIDSLVSDRAVFKPTDWTKVLTSVLAVSGVASFLGAVIVWFSTQQFAQHAAPIREALTQHVLTQNGELAVVRYRLEQMEQAIRLTPALQSYTPGPLGRRAD